jgi:PAS domain S-box-containing protein
MGQQVVDSVTLIRSIERMISLLRRPAFLFNKQGVLLTHNNSFSNFLGNPDKNYRNVKLSELGLPEESLYILCENAASGSLDFTIELKKQDNQPATLRISILEIPFLNEELLLAYCPENLKINSTEKKTEDKGIQIISEAFQQSEQQFLQLADSISDSIILRMGERILYINPAFKSIYGRSPSELVENSIKYRDLIHPDDRQKIEELLDWQTNEITSTFDEQYRILRPDGSSGWIWHRIFPVKNLDSEIYRYIELTTDISKQKELEAVLIRTKSQQKAILDNIPHLAWLKDVQSRYISVNESFAKFYKISADDLIGKTDKDLWNDEQAEYFQEKDQETIRSGKRQLFEEVIETTNGITWSETFKTPIFDENGNPSGVAGISIDITRRKMLEDELRISEEKFRSLLQYSSDAITILNEKGTITFESSLEGKISGYNIRDLIGRSALELVIAEDHDLFLHAITEVIANPAKTVKLEFRGKKKEGSIVYIESIFANHLMNPLIQGIVMNSRDITARKQAEINEKRYRENQAFLSCTALDFLSMSAEEDIYRYIAHRIFEITGDSIVIVGVFNESETTLRPVFFKGIEPYRIQLEELLHLTQNDIRISVDDRFRDVLSNNSKHLYHFRRGIYEAFNKKIDPELAKKAEEIMGVKHIEGISLMRQGKLYGTVLIMLKDEGNNLEKQTVETFLFQASIALHKRQLEQELIKAKVKAEESDKIKTAFLANMSHEIRTPMNGILGFAQLLSSQTLSKEDLKEYTQAIDSNGKLLISLIDDIIDISKIETGHVKLNPETIHLNEFLDEIFQSILTEPFREEKEHVQFILEKDLPDSDCSIETDPVRLRQVIYNLISNAVKFTSEGFIKVGYKLDSQNSLLFYVKDTGIGIQPQKLNLIFERFIQADDSITRKYGGSGLGLAISKGLVELMGGKIWVESTQMKGSSFYFSHPFKVINNQSAHHTHSKEDYVFKGKGKTVLVVEDDKFSFKYLEAILKRYEINILHAFNGLEAVEYCASNPQIALVLMDIQLPSMSGYDATRQIREMSKDLPIIAQTANAFDEDRSKCLAAGCNEYLAKPISLSTLVEMLTKYL